MEKPATMKELEELGRVRLSTHFFMREMLYSEIGNFHGLPNIPDDPDLAIAAGTRLCEEILEPLHATFGHVTVRSAFRSATVNEYGVERRDQGYTCGPTEWNYARHVWDRRDAQGCIGATASIVIPWFLPRYKGVGATASIVIPWFLRKRHPLAGAGLVGARPFALLRHAVLFTKCRFQCSLARETAQRNRQRG